MIIGRLPLLSDKERQKVENAWNNARKRNHLNAWLAKPAKRELKAECDNEIKIQAITVSESSYVVSPKAEIKEAVRPIEVKKCGRQRFC